MEEALTLSELERLRDEGKISDVIIAPDAVFAAYKSVCVNEQGLKMVRNGNRLGAAQLRQNMQNLGVTDREQVRVYDEEERFYGVYAYHEAERLLKPVKMFLD